MKRRGLPILAAIAFAVIAMGQDSCDTDERRSGSGPADSGPFEASSASIEDLVEGEGGKKVEGGCNRGNCNVTYVAETPVFSGDETIEGTAPIFDRLFSDKSVKEATLDVQGKLTSVGGKSSVDSVFVVTCDRRDDGQINWNRVDADGIRAICDFTPFVGDL